MPKLASPAPVADCPMSPADIAAHWEASYVWAPRESRVLTEPATTTTCRRDYEAGADVRTTAARQQKRTKR